MLGSQRICIWISQFASIQTLIQELKELKSIQELCEDEHDICACILLAGVGVSLACGVLFASLVGGIAAFAGLVLVLEMYAQRQKTRAHKELLQEIPQVFRSLSVALGSGQTLAQTIEYISAHLKGETAKAFNKVSLKMRCGGSAEEAIQLLEDEFDISSIKLLTIALIISHRTGSPLHDLFLRSAEMVEQQSASARTLSAKTAQVRLSVKIVCLLPLCMLVLLSLVSPDFQQGITTPTGLVCIMLATLLDALALVLIKKIMGHVII